MDKPEPDAAVGLAKGQALRGRWRADSLWQILGCAGYGISSQTPPTLYTGSSEMSEHKKTQSTKPAEDGICSLKKIISCGGEPYGVSELVVCPVCGDDYTHVVKNTLIDGKDDYQAWAGRGDCVKVLFGAECGAEWNVCFGFHKGNTSAFLEILRSCTSSKLVYFIESEGLGLIKIGKTKNDPRQRLSNLNTGNPDKLNIIGVLAGDDDTEKELHERFKHIRHKNEWFHGTEELRDFIEKNTVPYGSKEFKEMFAATRSPRT